MAHMVWGKGGLLNSNLGGRFPTLDFAGGTVLHITSGVSALVWADAGAADRADCRSGLCAKVAKVKARFG